MTNTYTVYKSLFGTGGRYKSSTPMSAAKKAASKLFKKMDESRGSSYKTIHFAIRETTSGSAHKVFKYVAKRVELAKPVVLTIKGKEIVYKYKIDIKSDGDAPDTSRELRAVAKKATVAKKACKAGKTRNATTGRCRKVMPKSTRKPCGSGKKRNPVTKRCRKVAKKTTGKKHCKKGMRRNPTTKRCRKIRGGDDVEVIDGGDGAGDDTTGTGYGMD